MYHFRKINEILPSICHFGVIITNLVFSILILIILSAYSTRALIIDLKMMPEPATRFVNLTSGYEPAKITMKGWMPDYGLPSEVFCQPYLTLSLCVEFFSQFEYTCGSVLILLGILKKDAGLCYAFVICGIISILISALMRFGQFFICDGSMDEMGSRTFPTYFKLTFIWLVVQLTWYWCMLGFLVAILNRMFKEKIKTLEEQQLSSFTSDSNLTHNTPEPGENDSKINVQQSDTKF